MTNHSTTASTNEWRKYDILIVDDELEVLKTIERDLYLENFSLIKAASGEEALEIINRQPVYVALCDQKMPGGMNGTTFLNEARKRQPHLVGIILSAFSEPEHLFSGINEAKAFYYLLKPWEPEELILRLTQALQLCHARMKEEKKQKEILRYTQNMLTCAIREAHHKEAIIKEFSQTLSKISEVTGELSANARTRLENTRKYDVI